uniref:Uncharacterized protein n=1 Tax=Opuntia streptacantha TaxID=393608 RepID=A0A7C9CN96_OPUST
MNSPSVSSASPATGGVDRRRQWRRRRVRQEVGRGQRRIANQNRFLKASSRRRRHRRWRWRWWYRPSRRLPFSAERGIFDQRCHSPPYKESKTELGGMGTQ